MNYLRFYILFNSISVISGRFAGDNERLCAKEPHLRLKGFPPQTVHEPGAARSILFWMQYTVFILLNVPGTLYFMKGGLFRTTLTFGSYLILAILALKYVSQYLIFRTLIYA